MSTVGESGGLSFENPLRDGPTVLVSAVGRAEGSRGVAAALACAGGEVDRAALLIEIDGRAPRPTLIASAAARELEERLQAHLPVRVAARGQICHVSVTGDEGGFDAAAGAVAVARGAVAVIHAAQPEIQGLLEHRLGDRLSGALLRADLKADRALVALVVGRLRGRGLEIGVVKKRLPWVVERRALFGALAPGGGLAGELVARQLEGVASRGRDSGSAAAEVPESARA
jgi:hypothetical protein